MILTKTEMYPHQTSAVEKLIGLRVGALYMEMGTGKTRTAIELASRRMGAGKIDRVLWLCPCSVKRNLEVDIAKHSECGSGDIEIYGIESISGSVRIYREIIEVISSGVTMLVVDESNLIKNHRAIRSQRITAIAKKCRYRMILNGTPISRTEADMFQQWFILDWRILGYRSFYSFAANHIEWDEKFTGRIRRVLNKDYLTDKIAPYSVQIRKADCISLPDKCEETVYFEMTPEQDEHYIDVISKMLDESNLHENEMTSVWIYKAFTASQEVASGRRITSHPADRIVHEPFFGNTEDNPRVRELMDVLGEIGDEKAVIWCKFQHEVDDVCVAIRNAGMSCVQFTGVTPQKRRQENLVMFYGDVQFLVANKQCAGYGLNLQFCHNAIYYNNDWDWATRAQSEDRLHRIGQDHRVRIINLCAMRTIDQRILDCLSRKGNMVEEFKRKVTSKNWNEWFRGKEEADLRDNDRIKSESETE